jgi:hypothetical protein
MRMKNTFTKIITVSAVLFTLNFISSCALDRCPPPVLFYLKAVSVQALDKVEDGLGMYSSIYTDTIRHQIAFEVRSIVEIASHYPNRLNWGLMNTAYGDCINAGITLNPIVIEKSRMFVDKPIYWEGGTIEPNTNMLENSEFKQFIDFPETLTYEGFEVVSIASIPLKFHKDSYVFTFEWETSDGIILRDEVEVVIRL